MSTAITRKSSDDFKQSLPAAPQGVLLDKEGKPVPAAPLWADFAPLPFVPSHGRAFEGALPETRGLVDLGAAAALRITGPDRESWLQGVHTADVKSVPEGGAVYTLFLNGRGRVVADAHVFRRVDELLVCTRTDRLDALFMHLDKLLIMEDAELTRAEGLHRLRWIGAAPADRAAIEGLRGSPDALGFELLVDEARAKALIAQLPERADAAALETTRIALGVPRWGQDFDADTTPLEAGLDRAIAFSKGCYVGQEVVAMATFRGRVQWNLVRLELEGALPAIGAALDPARGGKGRVTSATLAGTRCAILGIVHREKIAPGSIVELSDGRKATVLGLPYGSQPGAGVCA